MCNPESHRTIRLRQNVTHNNLEFFASLVSEKYIVRFLLGKAIVPLTLLRVAKYGFNARQ